jgi:hypothetical protein
MKEYIISGEVFTLKPVKMKTANAVRNAIGSVGLENVTEDDTTFNALMCAILNGDTEGVDFANMEDENYWTVQEAFNDFFLNFSASKAKSESLRSIGSQVKKEVKSVRPLKNPENTNETAS